MKTYGHFLPIFPWSPIPSLDNWGHEGSSSHGVYGATVATNNFLKYLIRYGTFDQYHLFVPDAILQTEADLRQKMLGKLSIDSRISLKGLKDFNPRTNSDYHAFHQCEGLRFLNLLSVRNQQTNNKTPITAVTHSISYQELFRELALLLMAGPHPWDSIVCTSKCGREAMLNLMQHAVENLSRETGATIQYNGRLDIIPLGVNTEMYQPREKPQLRRLLELPTDKLILLWFGRFSLTDKADLRPLLIAFRKACDVMTSNAPILLLAGEDVRRGDADNLAKFAAQLGLADRVLIRKNPSIASGPLYYSASDVFICPSDNVQETFGQTILEAMSSGLPVICSDWNGFRDTVVHGKVGFRIPTYWAQCDSKLCDTSLMNPWPLDHLYLSQSVCVDTDKMAEAIRLLSENHQLRGDMQAEARRHTVKNFDWRVVIRKYEELWGALNCTAAKAPTSFPRRADWLRPSYFSHFKSYPSEALTQAMIVKTSEFKLQLQDFQQSVYLNMGLSSPFRGDLVDSILHHASEGISVGELQRLCTKLGVSDEEVIWYTLRLLKYGYLSLPERADAEPRGTENLSLQGLPR